MPVTAVDPFAGENNDSSDDMANGVFAIVPSDEDEMPWIARSLTVTGAAGTVALVFKDGSEAMVQMEIGQTTANVFGARVREVKATGTTATGLVGTP